MTSFSDDFNRADSTDLGANWVEVSGEWSIVSNQLSPGSAGGTIILRAATAMATSDNFAQITIAATAAASQGVWCRGNSNITNGYLWRNSGSSWDLFAVVGGSFSMIATYAVAAAPGDVARVQAVGSAIKAYVNGVERASVTDTQVTTGTSVGVRSESTGALRYDDFSAGDVTNTISGTAAAAFGSLTGAAAGVRRVAGSAASALGALNAAGAGTVKVTASASAAGGTLAGAAAGVRGVGGVAAGALGALAASAVVSSSVTGTASAELSALTAHASGSAPAPVSQTRGGSWESLFSIVTEAVEYKRIERTQPPIACPFDGEPLDAGPGGVLHCKWGNYTYPTMPRII